MLDADSVVDNLLGTPDVTAESHQFYFFSLMNRNIMCNQLTRGRNHHDPAVLIIFHSTIYSVYNARVGARLTYVTSNRHLRFAELTQQIVEPRDRCVLRRLSWLHKPFVHRNEMTSIRVNEEGDGISVRRRRGCIRYNDSMSRRTPFVIRPASEQGASIDDRTDHPFTPQLWHVQPAAGLSAKFFFCLKAFHRFYLQSFRTLTQQ